MRTLRRGHSKRRQAISAVLLCAALATGCDYNDIDHLYIATGMGVDRATRGVHLSVDLIQPGGAGNPAAGQNDQPQGTAPDWIVSADAPTFEEAMSDLQAKLSHVLYLQHNALVLFSEEALRSGFAPIADALERNRQLRRSEMWVVTSNRAEAVLRSGHGQNEPISLMIRDLVDEAARREACLASDELHVVKALLRPSGVAPMAAIDLGRDGAPELAGLAYLRRDGKLAIVERSELLGAAWWLGRTLDVRETVRWTEGEKFVAASQREIGVHWLRTSTRLEVTGTGNSPRVRVVWRGTGEIERWGARTKMSARSFAELEDVTRRDVEQRLQAALEFARSVDMDAFGLTNACLERGVRLPAGGWRRLAIEYDVRPHIVHGQLASTTPFTNTAEAGED